MAAKSNRFSLKGIRNPARGCPTKERLPRVHHPEKIPSKPAMVMASYAQPPRFGRLGICASPSPLIRAETIETHLNKNKNPNRQKAEEPKSDVSV